MTLEHADEGKEYTISSVHTGDEEWNAFLFSLGCYCGETITVLSRKKAGITIAIKDGKYNIDSCLAKGIEI